MAWKNIGREGNKSRFMGFMVAINILEMLSFSVNTGQEQHSSLLFIFGKKLDLWSVYAPLSVHTPFLELVIMIKYRFSVGEWKIYYYHVACIACPRHVFTWHFHGLTQICWSQVWHTKNKCRHFCLKNWQCVFRLL